MQTASGKKGNRADVLAGAVMIGLGALGLLAGRDLQLGTPAMMGPGFLPDVICGILIAIGLFVFVKAFGRSFEQISKTNLRPLIILIVAIAGFAFLAERFGFVVSTIWLIAVGSMADQESRWREVAISVLLLTIFGAIVFIYALGVQMPMLPF